MWWKLARPGALLIAVAALALAMGAPASAESVTVKSGTLVDGSKWIAEVPSNWNGILLDFSHGLVGSEPTIDASGLATHQDLLAAGYALTGASFAPTGPQWPFNAAVNDQFQTIQAVENSALPSPPTSVIAWGESMGGLVSELMAQDSNSVISGALNLCPLAAGAQTLEDYTLDGAYALNELLDPGTPVQLVSYQSSAQAAATATQLMQMAQAAQTTAAGQARLALASALYNITTWTAVNIAFVDSNPKVRPPLLPPPPTDYPEQEYEQYESQFAPGSAVMAGQAFNRYVIEQAVGGQPAGDMIDFTSLIDNSPYYPEVAALYSAAGLNLNADLQTLTANADISGDADALANLVATSVPTGQLQVPELNLHTVADQIVPVQQENYYQQLVEAAGDADDLGLAYVFRQGHCNFKPTEQIAALEALVQRIDTGSWGTSLSPSALNSATSALGGGSGAFINYTPPPLTVAEPAGTDADSERAARSTARRRRSARAPATSSPTRAAR